METYSLSVALFDFIPVILNAIAMPMLALAIGFHLPRFRRFAWLAAISIPLGGLCKASWKLILAIQNTAYDYLENMLFILMAPGFVAMAFGLHHAVNAWLATPTAGDNNPSSVRPALWLALTMAGAALAAVLSPETRLWFFWLLLLTSLANISLLFHAIRATHRKKLGLLTMGSFVFNLLAMLAMGGLSRLPAGEASAWIQQSVNLFAQAALLYGCWRLSHAMRTQY
ncbi:MAG: hypothetical protein ACSHXK_07310 [Oceanococcus sp.]